MDRLVKPLLLIATLVCLSPMLAGCTSSPRTQLSWGVNDQAAPRKTAAVVTHPLPKTYVYEDKYYDAPRPTPRPAPTPAYRPASYQPAPSGNVAFAWPVSGRVIADYGSEANGARNDGINIAAPMNTPIRAAASGTVTYSGNELKGYGNLLLIKHADGYVTAYAHADRLLVARGDFVAKGQVIGYAGQTGDVTSPQLHFEIRHDTQPVNPRAYLVAKANS